MQKKIRIDLIAGARPNFVKLAPVIHALDAAIIGGWSCEYRLIHTGQHYDHALSQSFFDQLQIPIPKINLGVGSGSQAEQTAKILVAYEAVLLSNRADLTLVFGDVTSTLACSLAAAKLNIPIAHVEGGIRSGDREMPEEINRIVTDALSSFFFTTTKEAGSNLLAEGKNQNQIFWVGNTMIDSLIKNSPRFFAPSIFGELSLAPKKYLVMTLHRPSNVDNPKILSSILKTVADSCLDFPVVFPTHPRVRKMLNEMQYQSDFVKLIDPLSYLEFNYLVMHSGGVITDSGGITEETTVLNIPCLTLRNSTERPETCTIGTNVLVGDDLMAMGGYITRMVNGQWHSGGIPELWDGRTSERIVNHLQKILN